MTIEEIYYSEDISVRTFNVCNDNQLIDLNAILKHYRKYGKFGNLRNCGRKCDKEFTALCMKYMDIESNQIAEPSKPENKLITTIANFTRTQREIVNNFIEINTNNLSNRSKNAINSFLNGNLKIRNISERILTNDKFSFRDIRNVGTKTVTELKSFFGTIIDFIEKVAEVENENDLVALRNRFFIEKTFSISSIPIEILESQSIFSLVDFLINKDVIFEKNENIIFKKAFKIYDKQPVLSLDDIAEEINISRERVRQIRKGIIENLLASFQFTRNIEDDLYQKYDIDQNHQLIYIDDDLNNLINGINKTNFSNEFNTFIIYTYFSDNFDLIGEVEDVLIPKYFNSRERHNWDNFYLVNKKINCLFNLIDFANDLDKRSSERIEESYNFNFKSYLLSFFSSNNLDELDIVSVVAENILNNEFGIYIDTDDNIRFNRNSLKQAHEYSYEALKLLGKPSKVNEIAKKVKELNPDYETNEAKVRVSMKRQNGFVPIGRRSIFGLKEWENELENFKGGTIRSIVSEYLESKIDPKHISEITEYVLKYRMNTNERNVLTNLKFDQTRTFVFFKNSTIGLKSKKYDNSFVEINQIETSETKSWKERYNDFSQFISINKRLPFSNGANEEVKLYRWFNVQKGKIKNGKLDDEKKMLNDIINKTEIKEIYDSTSLNNKGSRRRKNDNRNLKYNYGDLIEFITINKRMPDSRDPNESRLYQFYNRNKKNLENIDALSTNEAKLVELIDNFGSSKNYKYTIDELLEFIKTNKRMPDYCEPNERGLYNFFYRQRKLFKQGELEQYEETQFIEIAKVIKKS